MNKLIDESIGIDNNRGMIDMGVPLRDVVILHIGAKSRCFLQEILYVTYKNLDGLGKISSEKNGVMMLLDE